MVRWERAPAAVAGLAAFGALAFAVELGRTAEFDLAVRAAVHGWASPTLTAAMRLMTTAGSGYFLVPLAAILVWRWEARGKHASTILLTAGGLSAEALSELLKMLFHRPRPDVFFGLSPAETYSFPSGHAFITAVYFGILWGIPGRGRRWRVAAAALTAVVGFSRVYLGYHYPTDVIAGWALGLAWLALWATVAERSGLSNPGGRQEGRPPASQ